jgi:hypothetical protein
MELKLYKAMVNTTIYTVVKIRSQDTNCNRTIPAYTHTHIL